jgi:hypothetical protein
MGAITSEEKTYGNEEQGDQAAEEGQEAGGDQTASEES